MGAPALTKVIVNGYEVINVGGIKWVVCTSDDRLGEFMDEPAANAFALTLPPHRVKPEPQDAGE